MVKPIVRAVLLFIVFVVPAVAQQPAPELPLKPQVPAGPKRQQPDEPLDPHQREVLRQQRLTANRERQAALKRDTDHLLQLATELKLYVDKTNENVLSLNVIKKTEEIEKLAHSIREKMKNAY